MKKARYVTLILSLGLSACDRVETIKSQYEAKSQIPISANSIVVTYDFNPYSKSSESDQFFSKTLVREIEKWAKVRFSLVSPYGVAQISVREATVVYLPNVKNPEALEGRLDVLLNEIDKNGNISSYAETKVIQKLSAPINMTQKEHDILKRDLIVKLVDALDAEMEETLYKKRQTPYSGRILK